MIKVNPAHAHNGPNGVQRSMVANAASNSSLHSDPAGFASLLKQNQTKAPPAAHAHAPAPPPAPKPAAPPAQQAAKAPAPANDSAPSKAESDSSAGTAPADATHSTQAADASNSTARGKATQRARQTNDTNATAAQRAARRTATQDTATTATADAANDAKKDVSAQANPADTPIDPAVMQWLAGQQRGIPTSTDARAAKAGLDGKAAADDKNDALGAAAQKSARAELRADAKDGAVAVDKALQGKTLGDTLGAEAGFAAMLAEKRAADGHETPSGPIVEAKDASAAIGAASFAPEHGASAVADAPVAVAVQTPVDSPEFPKVLGLHMSVLAKDGVTQAELHLNPADMGPVSVQIVMDGTQARVDFGADVAATRHAIEAGLPELASALRDAGFTLAGGGVSDSSRGAGGGGGSFGSDARSGGRQARAVDAATTAKVSAAARRVVTKGGVDLFV